MPLFALRLSCMILLSALDPERVYEEIEKCRKADAKKLDLEELGAVAGGFGRDWQKEGCAATCEWDTWCWSNDYCNMFEVTYQNYYATCPDGQEHDYRNHKCIRCGATLPFPRGY